MKKLNVTTAEVKLQQCGNKRGEEEVEQMKKSLWSSVTGGCAALTEERKVN